MAGVLGRLAALVEGTAARAANMAGGALGRLAAVVEGGCFLILQL
jgi:hypothetical protein